MGKISDISTNLKKNVEVPMKHKTCNVYAIVSFILDIEINLRKIYYLLWVTSII